VLQLAALRDSLGDVDLALQAGDACVCSVGLGHHAADATPDFLRLEELGVCDLHSTVLIATSSDGAVTCVFILVKLEILRAVNFRLEKHILLVVVWGVHFH